MKYKLYEVGGKIRDEFLGLKSKDIDYTVVIDEPVDETTPIGIIFEEFVEQIESEGYQVFVVTPDCFTVRAKFPKDHQYAGTDADFVLARKELGYIKGTRRPYSVLGTLEDDLARRDFTVNTLAKDEDGNIVDLYNGQKDLIDGILRTPSDAAQSFSDDPLRILRAMRFAITKDLEWSDEMWRAFDTFSPKKLEVVSVERKREELFKCFKHDTIKTLQFLRTMELYNSGVYYALLPREIVFVPTITK